MSPMSIGTRGPTRAVSRPAKAEATDTNSPSGSIARPVASAL